MSSNSGGRSSGGAVAITTALTICAGAVAGWVYLWNRQREDENENTPTADFGTKAAAEGDGVPPRTVAIDEAGKNAVRNGTRSSANDLGGVEEEQQRKLRTDLRSIQRPGTITIAYATTTQTCQKLAESLYKHLVLKVGDSSSAVKTKASAKVQMCRVEELDWWDEVLNPDLDEDEDDNDAEQDGISKPNKPIVLLILPTWSGGTLPPHSQILQTSLEEISNDWRVEQRPLAKHNLSVGAFGIGSSAYDSTTFCQPARDVVRVMTKLGAQRLVSVGTGDVEVGDYRDSFRRWTYEVLDKVGERYKIDKDDAAAGEGCCGGGTCGSTQEDTTTAKTDKCCGNGTCNDHPEKVEEKEEEKYAEGEGDDDESYYSDEDDEDDEGDEGEAEIMDLEDIGDAMKSSASERSSRKGPPKEMVTPKQAIALKKEGYKLIGTHSAVKLCRWTKHQLRGRGGCYKHTHYGITSYQCMEATPSLACANKCVFCWRHHKNPVGREWRWKTDEPAFIVEEAVNMHIKMIKETRGIPGVRMDRWEEAHTVRHCALSLVGEPIMYPRINELLGHLHDRKISTFLVTNGQHPDAIESLRPITQLYVSVDAPTPDSLEAIDRPLFRDAWDRLRRSLRCLKDKGQRTVARLTVVKGWNSDEIGGYAKLIALGHCSLVEVKGVTFCGKSDASNLNMSNTPWHHEVVELTTKLRDELNLMHDAGGDNAPPRYELACEHKHSVSVLLARVDQFAVDDPVTGERKWRTWIDYDKFHVLAAKAAADPTFTFGVEDYTAETPSWAVFGSNEEGFDPTDTRHRKKNKHPKYTKFDQDGIPTHDHAGNLIGKEEISALREQMEQKMREIGICSTVTAQRDGEIKVEDASLMFRGLTITT